MPRISPYEVELTEEEKGVLQETARKYTSPYCDVLILYVAPVVNSLQVTALQLRAATTSRSNKLASSQRRLAR